ncbi:MipA/OmpV family protein [Sphingomonas sp. RB3P16]
MIDRRFLLSAAALMLASAAPAYAQSASPAPADNDQLAADLAKDNVTVGVAGAFLPDYDGSNDYRFVPAPAAIGSVGGFNFSVIGNRASVDLIPNRPGQKIDLQFGPIGVINFDRSSLKNIDDVRVRALGKRSTTLELGGYVGIGKTGIITSPYDKLSVSVSYRKGVTGAHNSEIWQPSLTYLTPLSRKAAVGILASAQHVGQGYADTYFSITPTQSLASGLPTYNARKGWKNYSVGGFATYSLTGDLLHGFKVIAGGTYSRSLGDFSYSPIVRIAGSPNQWLGAAGIAYTF